MIQKNLSWTQYLALSTIWSESFPCWTQYLFCVISNLQCLAISFANRLKFLANTKDQESLKALKMLFNLIALGDLEDIQLSITTLVILTLLYFSIILAIFIVMGAQFFQKRNLQNVQACFFNIICQFHIGIGFWSTTIILIEALKYGQADDTSASEELLKSIWAKILYFTIIALNFVLTTFLSLFSYGPLINSGGLSSHSVMFQFMTFLSKACLAIVIFAGELFMDSSNDATPWVLFVTSVILFTIRHCNLIRVFPYYEYPAMRLCLFLSLTCLLSSITNLLAFCIRRDITLSALQVCYVDLLMIPLLVKYWSDYFYKAYVKYLSLPNQKITSESVALKKLFCLRNLSKQVKLMSNKEQSADILELYFFGYFSHVNKNRDVKKTELIEKENRKTKSANFKASSESLNLKINDVQESLSDFWRKRVIELIQEMIKMFDNFKKLGVISVCIFLEDPDNLSTSIFHLSALSKIRGFEKIVILKLYNKLQNNINLLFAQKEEKALRIGDTINLEIISTKLIQMIHSNSQKYLGFWKTYNDANLEVKVLYKKSREIENEHDIINKFWSSIIEKNSNFACSLSTIYSIYLSIVRNSPAAAQRIFEKYRREVSKKMYQKLRGVNDDGITDANIDDPDIIMLHVSMTKEKAGKITYVSSNIIETLGWQKHNLLGQNINQIIPNFLQEQHNQIMLSHLNKIIKGTSLSSLKRTIYSFAKDKDNFILPCQVYLSLHPFIQNELTYVGLIKIRNINQDHIVINKDGFIESASRGICLQLNLKPGHQTQIKDICNNYNILEENIQKLMNLDTSEKVLENSSDKKIITEATKINIVLQFINLKSFKEERRKVVYKYSTQTDYIKAGNRSFTILNLIKINTAENPQLSKELIKQQDEIHSIFPDEKLISDDVITLASPFSSNMPQSANDQIKAVSPVLKGFKINNLYRPSNPLEHMDQSSRFLSEKSSTRREMIQKRQIAEKIFQNLDDCPDASSLSVARRYNNQIEKAAKILPKAMIWGALKICLIIYLFEPVVTTFLFQLENGKTLDKIDANVDILSQSVFRLTKLTEICRMARYFVQLDVNLIYSKRYDFLFGPGLDLKKASIPAFEQYANELNILNNNIRDSIHKIEPDLRNLLYHDEIPVLEPDIMGKPQITRFANPFDLATEIVAAAKKIANTPADELNPENAEINFIMNNTFNEMLVSGERISPILLEDTDLKLENKKFLIFIFIILKTCFLGIILIILYKVVRNFLQKRNQFIEILLYLGKENIASQTNVVEKFIRFLEKNNLDIKRINLKLEPDQFTSHDRNPTSQNAKSKRIPANYKGINNTLGRIIFCTFIFLCIAFSINLILIFITASQKTMISNKLNLMVESNFILYRFKLLRAVLFEYIQENGTTMVRNKPIKEEWNDLSSQLANFQEFLGTDLLNKDYGIGDDKEFTQVVKGNICEVIPSDATIKSLCGILGAGSLEKGLVGYNSYLLASLMSTKLSFDNSKMTFMDKFLAINSVELIVADLMEYFFSDASFQLIDNLIKTRVKENLKQFQTSLINVIIIYVIVSVVLGIPALKKITSKIEEEFNCWRKIIRLVPYGILIHNKMLRSYLIKNSNGLLNNLK